MNLVKNPARNEYPLHDLIRQRYSPRAYDADRLIPHDAILSLLEAARWSPSSNNRQPWRFIVAPRDDRAAYDKLFSLLAASNQSWAKNAALLMLALVDMRDQHVIAHHDVGAAVMNMTVQATALGLGVRQIGGMDYQLARTIYQIPDDYAVSHAMAIGYPTHAHILPEDQAYWETAPRQRQALSEMVFREWGEVSPLLPDN